VRECIIINQNIIIEDDEEEKKARERATAEKKKGKKNNQERVVIQYCTYWYQLNLNTFFFLSKKMRKPSFISFFTSPIVV